MRGWDRQTADMSVLNNGEKIKIYVHRERTEWKISFRFALGVVRGVVYAFSLLLFFFFTPDRSQIGFRQDSDTGSEHSDSCSTFDFGANLEKSQ